MAVISGNMGASYRPDGAAKLIDGTVHCGNLGCLGRDLVWRPG